MFGFLRRRRSTTDGSTEPGAARRAPANGGAKGSAKGSAKSAVTSGAQALTHGISPELRKQVKLIELKTRGLVNTMFSGEYRSVFKGQGMEFAEVREYLPGDEVRAIDWNVTARMRRPFIKRYIEERELTVMLVLDMSGSEQFGTVRRFKSELVTEFASLIAMSAIRNNDRVGVLFFTDRVEHTIAPRKGRRHVLRIVRDMIAFQPAGRKTDLGPALEYLRRTLHHHTIVFVVSDFMAEGFEQPMRSLAVRHDVVAVTVNDPGEDNLPNIGVARLVDPETGEYVEVDTSAKSVRAWYAERVAGHSTSRRKTLRRMGIDEIPLTTANGVVEPLLKFFRNRETRLRRR
jgi:uncharacterized protein (DUF58 family)